MTTLLGMRTENFTDKSPDTWELGLVVRDRRGDIDLTHERWASFRQQGRGTGRYKGPEGGEKGEKACFWSYKQFKDPGAENSGWGGVEAE